VTSGATTNHFALAREKDKVAASPQLAMIDDGAVRAGNSYVMAMMRAFLHTKGRRVGETG
jgi:hypothetical protein